MPQHINELAKYYINLQSELETNECQKRIGLPSRKRLYLLVKEITSLVFPNYFNPESEISSVECHLKRIEGIAAEQIERGICFICDKQDKPSCDICKENAKKIAKQFMQELPRLQQDLEKDAKAAFYGDPAAVCIHEVVFAYPGIRAIIHHRIAHLLHKLKAPIIPRIISEIAHSKTGIDIHPGAQIGNHFFIDHGTGVVVGETTIIGNNVKLYQGVTLGAKSFPTDDQGKPMKGINRHPIISDNVTIYAGATILGRVTIGDGATIGGNVWLTTSIAPGEMILQQKRS